MSLRTFLVVNPASGGGSTGRGWTQLRRRLERQIGRWEEGFTTHAGHAESLVRRAVEAGFERVVVVGGDGTFNEAVCGLFPEDPEFGIAATPMNPNVVLAPVRRGTGGDLARHLGLPGTGDGALRHLVEGHVRPIDLGLCDFVDAAGRPRRRAFANIASFGLSGLVDAKVNDSGKRFGSLSFATAIGAAFLEYRRQPVRIRVDGEVWHEGPMLLGAVANGPYFGGGVRFAPEAELDDGLFDVALLRRVGLGEARRALDLYSGRHARWGAFRSTRGRVIETEILDGSDCLLDVDGEQPGLLDARFELIPTAVRLQS